jgi:aminocarboxymuconate-semialdehyde decarboxylase
MATTHGELLTIDAHAHHVPRMIESVDRRLSTRRRPDGSAMLYLRNHQLGELPATLTDVSLLLASMDRQGLQMRAICAASWLTFCWAEPALGATLACGMNELLVMVVSASAGRLVGLASVPLQDVEAAIAEMRHVCLHLGMSGIAIGANVGRTYLDDPRFDPFFAVAQELDAPLFPPPGSIAGAEGFNDDRPHSFVDDPHAATISVTRLISRTRWYSGALPEDQDLRPPTGGGSFAYSSLKLARPADGRQS